MGIKFSEIKNLLIITLIIILVIACVIGGLLVYNSAPVVTGREVGALGFDVVFEETHDLKTHSVRAVVVENNDLISIGVLHKVKFGWKASYFTVNQNLAIGDYVETRLAGEFYFKGPKKFQRDVHSYICFKTPYITSSPSMKMPENFDGNVYVYPMKDKEYSFVIVHATDKGFDNEYFGTNQILQWLEENQIALTE